MMKFVASAFTFLHEALLVALGILFPVIAVVGTVAQGSLPFELPVQGLGQLILGLVIYYAILISLFGFVALTIENNRYLREISESLKNQEQAQRTARQSNPSNTPRIKID